jgi:hypothetical protein
VHYRSLHSTVAFSFNDLRGSILTREKFLSNDCARPIRVARNKSDTVIIIHSKNK